MTKEELIEILRPNFNNEHYPEVDGDNFLDMALWFAVMVLYKDGKVSMVSAMSNDVDSLLGKLENFEFDRHTPGKLTSIFKEINYE